MNDILTVTTTSSQSGSGSNDNKKMNQHSTELHNWNLTYFLRRSYTYSMGGTRVFKAKPLFGVRTVNDCKIFIGHLFIKINKVNLKQYQPKIYKVYPRGVSVKVMDCGILVSVFKPQSLYYVHFRTKYSSKKYEPHDPPS